MVWGVCRRRQTRSVGRAALRAPLPRPPRPRPGLYRGRGAASPPGRGECLPWIGAQTAESPERPPPLGPEVVGLALIRPSRTLGPEEGSPSFSLVSGVVEKPTSLFLGTGSTLPPLPLAGVRKTFLFSTVGGIRLHSCFPQ